MPTPTPRIGYPAPLTTDDYDTSKESDRWFMADDYPGVFICTSGTRPNSGGSAPVWDSIHEGMLIFETDSDLLWRWNGSGFVRQHAVGHLATNRRTSDLTVASGTYTNVAQASVTVPEGGRDIQVTASWPEVSGGAALMALYRGASLLLEWKVPVGSGASQVYVDAAPSSGATTYTLKVKNAAATTTVECASTSPASIYVQEV